MVHPRFVLIGILLLGVFLAYPPCVFACSCALPEVPDVARDQATAVFVGKVVDMIAPTSEVMSTADPMQVTFEVITTWKGPAYTTLVVTTARSDSSCGYPFRLGHEYLVYAAGSVTRLETNLCGRTRPLSEGREDFVVFGPGVAPTKLLPASLTPPTVILPTTTDRTPYPDFGMYPDDSGSVSDAAYPIPTTSPIATSPAARTGLPFIVVGVLGIMVGVLLIGRYQRRNR